MNKQKNKQQKIIRHARNKRIAARFEQGYINGVLPDRNLKSVEMKAKIRLDRNSCPVNNPVKKIKTPIIFRYFRKAKPVV